MGSTDFRHQWHVERLSGGWSEDGVAGKEVGKIHIFDNCAYVAVCRHVADQALRTLTAGKLKGRSGRVRKIR